MAQPEKGTLKEWNDKKGYGFIQPDDRSTRVFLHISKLAGSRRPRIGDRISYEMERNRGQKIRAKNAQILNSTPNLMNLDVILPVAVSITCILILYFRGGAIYFVTALAWYSLISLITFYLYGEDKYKAKQGRMRTSEKTLHLWELIGGFPGAALAQQFYRHKSKKKSYQIEFAIAIAIHVFVVFYLIFSWS